MKGRERQVLRESKRNIKHAMNKEKYVVVTNMLVCVLIIIFLMKNLAKKNITNICRIASNAK